MATAQTGTLNTPVNAIDVYDQTGLGVRFRVKSDGATQIGAGIPLSSGVAANAHLSVDGLILAKDIRVSISATHWADYVFDKNYKLMPLSDLEKFVHKNKHLPEVPSESEVKEQGVDVAAMNALLLKKVEELTLYMIDLKKESQALKAEIENLKTQNK